MSDNPLLDRFLEQVSNVREIPDVSEDDFLDWLCSVYSFSIPDNKEPGESAFGVLDYYYMESLGAFFKKQYAELAALRARVAELEAALENLFQSCSDLPLPEMTRMEKEINAASIVLQEGGAK